MQFLGGHSHHKFPMNEHKNYFANSRVPLPKAHWIATEEVKHVDDSNDSCVHAYEEGFIKHY